MSKVIKSPDGKFIIVQSDKQIAADKLRAKIKKNPTIEDLAAAIELILEKLDLH